jgi:hypothetical protein
MGILSQNIKESLLKKHALFAFFSEKFKLGKFKNYVDIKMWQLKGLTPLK